MGILRDVELVELVELGASGPANQRTEASV